jgi:hypothetical protein
MFDQLGFVIPLLPLREQGWSMLLEMRSNETDELNRTDMYRTEYSTNSQKFMRFNILMEVKV